ncbi:MAG: MoxR family ATPase [Kofleriaceae bacterium]|jgi:MoxR-like ATPase|nr:MoxR family ATPase [Kofleriaceae bacterium]MBP6836078.1 MoxR family ATPase [Kofleriaceae bacterium]MBP9205200.1 MoxR family ATPase [Kofleriaceae bacterium]
MSDRLSEDTAKLQNRFNALKSEISRVLVGQDDMVHRLLLGLIAGGHVLLEGVPGLAKTLVVRTLADALDGTFTRIQFTPDMLPGDVVGTQIFNPREGSYSIKKGPVFGNLVLADEINRAPAKVQSALLEAMQERQVTIGDQTFKLPEPFLVLATQNPIEQEGTYPLPEAQLDRFMLKLKVGYPSRDEEVKILDRMAGASAEPHADKVMTLDEVLAARDLARQVFVDDKVKRYAVDVVSATRDPKAMNLPQLAALIDNGASVRASIALIKIAKAHALLAGRTYISPHDVKTVAHDVLRHRVMISYEAEAQGKTADHVVEQILENVPVP